MGGEREIAGKGAAGDGRAVKITSSHVPICETVIETAPGQKFLAITERDRGGCLTTRIFNQGKIVYTKKTGPVADGAEGQVLSRHDFVIKLFRQDYFTQASTKKASEYVDDVRGLIKNGKLKPALETAELAAAMFPENILLVSYRGFLLARVKRQFKEGVSQCLAAISGLHDKVPFGAEFFYPILYLNLGRAYLGHGEKALAVSAFANGMMTDPGNGEIAWEMKKLGTRKKPVFSFLARSNPINIWAGKIRSWTVK